MTAATPTIEQAYADCEKLIHCVCHSFHRRAGGDYEELLADANAIFTSAYRSWTPAKGPLNKRVAYAVWQGLTERRRRAARRHRVARQLPLAEAVDGQTPDPRADAPYPRLTRLLNGLGGDARAAAEVVMNTAHNTRRTLTRFLLDAGWAAARVMEAYRELREALR